MGEQAKILFSLPSSSFVDLGLGLEVILTLLGLGLPGLIKRSAVAIIIITTATRFTTTTITKRIISDLLLHFSFSILKHLSLMKLVLPHLLELILSDLLLAQIFLMQTT